MADFDQQSAAFKQWFTSIPGAEIHPSVAFKDLRGKDAGRGLVASVDIPAETALFTIPRAAIMSVATSSLVERLPELFAGEEDTEMGDEDDETESNSPDPWSSLILVIIFEHLRGAASPWAQYFTMMPSQFDTPMFWSSAELQELQASPLVSRIGKEEAEEMFRRKIVPTIQGHKDIFYPPGTLELSEQQIIELAHRVGSTIMAYAFDLENDENEDESMEEDGWVVDSDGLTMLGMVPMADMMNADAEFNAHVNHGEDALTVFSLRPIAAGEEILNYYGPHPNSELLRKYGYVSERHSRYDVVEVPFSMVRKQVQAYLELSDQFWEKAENFLDEDEVGESIVLERNSGDPGPDGLFQCPATVENTLDELANQVNLVLKALRKVSSSVVPDKRKREEICNGVMLRILTGCLAMYPTTLAQDRALLADKSVTGRLRMAVFVRAGEKQLLEDILAGYGWSSETPGKSAN
ncbi:Ribosomal lysine N-methyltransferase 4 [Ceratocystis fimbriata CBS 114723]|uniref:Ribosomal N-lysine methyltransferase 4 n=2 Tax=Ceratocystis TaxID=5157 RepID=A0A0F8DEB2_CERFI|nr:Ribosomal N-lysine methyltransferase 4 [Ceratocystis platani]PHH51795.1 Ribosomal lysine N-methyltransferase 4 [Ceratocystis fimbriata CBS 114723]